MPLLLGFHPSLVQKRTPTHAGRLPRNARDHAELADESAARGAGQSVLQVKLSEKYVTLCQKYTCMQHLFVFECMVRICSQSSQKEMYTRSMEIYIARASRQSACQVNLCKSVSIVVHLRNFFQSVAIDAHTHADFDYQFATGEPN